jgi:hypothetical protein
MGVLMSLLEEREDISNRYIMMKMMRKIIEVEPPQGDIVFRKSRVGDPGRLHRNLFSMIIMKKNPARHVL